MKQQKKLYNKAKHLQTEEAWCDYRNMKNNITNLIRESHSKYQNKMFSNNEGMNYKKFWRYVKTIRKDTHGIAPLKVENKQFQSVFTKENLSNIPECSGLPITPVRDSLVLVYL